MGGTVPPPSIEITPETTIQPADISNWTTVAPIGQGFGVAFPGPPSTRSTTIAELRAPTTVYSYTDPSDRTYLLARSRLPDDITSIEGQMASLRRIAQTMLKGTLPGSKVSPWRETTFDDRPAIRYSLAAGQMRSEGFLILDEQILYRVSVTYDVSKLDRSFVEGFLGSFALSIM